MLKHLLKLLKKYEAEYWLIYIEGTDRVERKVLRALRRYFYLQKKRVINAWVENRFFDLETGEWIYDWTFERDLLKQLLLILYDKSYNLGLARADNEIASKEKGLVDYSFIHEQIKEKLANRLSAEIIDTTINRLLELWKEGASIDEIKELFADWEDWRAEMIARTETIRASNIAYLQQMELAGFKYKKWITGLDEKVCKVCSGLNGQKRLLFEPFSTGVLYPPQHPNCRCTIIIDKKERVETPYKAEYEKLVFTNHKDLNIALNTYIPLSLLNQAREEFEKVEVVEDLKKDEVELKENKLIIPRFSLGNRQQARSIALSVLALLFPEEKIKCKKYKPEELSKEGLYYWSLWKLTGDKRYCLLINITK